MFISFTFKNYYYLLMDLSWRNENDWIHRNDDNKLLEPLQAINYCRKRNIREKNQSSGEAVQLHYECEIERKLPKMMAITPNAGLLQKCIESLLKKSFANLKQYNKMTWVYNDIKRQHEKLKEHVCQSICCSKIPIIIILLTFAS